MLFSYNWIQQYIKEQLPKPEKLAEIFQMHAFEIEEVKKQNGDALFDISVLPNRAHDCLSHTGIAREIVALLKYTFVPPRIKKPLRASAHFAPLKISIEHPEFVPRYKAFVIANVHVQESPKWLKERLEAVGVNSINNVVDITNFVMLETGQPLHAFDYDTIQGKRMNVRQSKTGEKIETLDGKVLLLPNGTLVIEDTQGIIDLAGIKGGKRTGISSVSKNIVLQAAHFDPGFIHRTKKSLGFTTQAGDIYSHGIDPNTSDNGLERAWYLLHEIRANGNLVQIIDIYPKKRRESWIKLQHAYIQSLLGIAIPTTEVKALLKRIGCAVQIDAKNPLVYRVQIPTRRMDIAIQEDLIEEIGRIYGYERIPATMPLGTIRPPNRNINTFWQDHIRDSFQAAGFTESTNYSFVGEKDLTKFRYSGDETSNMIELSNPISEDFKYLRTSLLEGLLQNVERNYRTEQEIKIFEIGKVFQKKQAGAQESFRIAGIAVASRSEGFYTVKGLIDFVLNRMGITEVWYDEYQPHISRSILWYAPKTAAIRVGNKQIGFLGEISPAVLTNLKVAKGVAAFEINAQELFTIAKEEKEYRPISKFPSTIRDIAVLVPIETRAADVMSLISNTGGKLLSDVDLFDIYDGKEISENKKNLAFHLIYQSNDRTLTNQEVDSAFQKIIQTFEKNSEWEIRT